MIKKTFLATLLVVMTLPVLAQADWASDMFTTTSHNFGMVARGADTRFSFVFTNKYQEDVVIDSVRSTCRCTQPSFKKRVIKAWETGQVDIQLDTRNFYGQKDATITVRFSKPFYAEVQLHSYCYIRSDVYVEPGIVAFGTVLQGQPRTATFRVNYAGRANWQKWEIRDVLSEYSFYKASLNEVRRELNAVSYDVTLTLKENAPEGYLNDFIDIISNDPNPNNQHCPVPVSGYIIPSVAVKPSPLSFGTIKAGQSLTKTVVLSGQNQFKITEFGSSDDRVSVKISDEQKKAHIIPVTIANATGKAGKINGTLAFKVSSQDAIINLPFSATLEPRAEDEQTDSNNSSTLVQKSDDVPSTPPSDQTASKPKVVTPADEYFPANRSTEPEKITVASKPNMAANVSDAVKESPNAANNVNIGKSDNVPIEEIELPPSNY